MYIHPFICLDMSESILRNSSLVFICIFNHSNCMLKHFISERHPISSVSMLDET